MEDLDLKVQSLKDQVSTVEAQLSQLRADLAHAESRLAGSSNEDSARPDPESRNWPMSPDEYLRYGRQMILPSIGVQGQLRLREASVLVVGLGGLGCPAATYLAGAGIGRIGLVDGDVVEVSNLHRQILHRTPSVGRTKVDSAIQTLTELNPLVSFVPHREPLTPSNAASIFADYDAVLDCTDHPTSRYLISDAAVLLQKALVTASALRTEGQLMVLNHPALPPGAAPPGGPCYRCIFPHPPPAETVSSCGDAGILGPVVGIMGVLQALETLKLLTGPLSPAPPAPSTLLLFSALSNPQFRTVRLRGRRADCAACSAQRTVSLEALASGTLDYGSFCGLLAPTDILAPEERVSAREYERTRQKSTPHALLDVREKVHFDICRLDGSVNLPWPDMQSSVSALVDVLLPTLPRDAPIFVVCRLGNDSQLAVRRLKDAGLDSGGRRWVGDVRGGYRAWREEVDRAWPEY
ncbi:MAG: Urmylation protein [Thelocarpon impressellum]|nr:MAG: Urmylation protein [Thelocarpon impressellum]